MFSKFYLVISVELDQSWQAVPSIVFVEKMLWQEHLPRYAEKQTKQVMRMWLQETREDYILESY